MYNLDQFRAAFAGNDNVRFREEIVGGRSLTIVCYMMTDDELWKLPLGAETRGITFDTATGLLVSMPYEKFFNVNEKEHTQASIVAALMNDYGPAEVCEKVDGSMITGLVVNDRVYLKTKKSFTSDVAIMAQNAMTQGVEECIRYFTSIDMTPIFEFMSPDSKIVVNYGDEPHFRLIAIRSMADGKYLTQEALDAHADKFNLGRPSWFYSHDLTQLMIDSGTAEGTEGWVIYAGPFMQRNRYKVKTRWYMDRHRMIDIRERDIAALAADDKLDDLIPEMLETGVNMETVYAIQHQVQTDILDLMGRAAAAGQIASYIPDGIERVKWVNENHKDIAGFVFRASRGLENRDENFIQFYKQKHLKSFSLRSVGNPSFSRVADDE